MKNGSKPARICATYYAQSGGLTNDLNGIEFLDRTRVS